MGRPTALSPEQFRNLYCDLMEEVKRRTAVVGGVLAFDSQLPLQAAYELCYLQLRFVCELIAIGSLAAHGDVSGLSSSLLKEYRPDRLFSKFASINADFYPKPSKQILDSSTGRPIEVVPINTGYLTKAELVKLYAKCGEVLHLGSLNDVLRRRSGGAHPPLDLAEISTWQSKITNLLSHHQIQLVDKDYQFFVLMQGEDGKVHGALMKRLPSSKSRPA